MTCRVSAWFPHQTFTRHTVAKLVKRTVPNVETRVWGSNHLGVDMNSMDAGGAALLTGYSVIIDAECDKSQSWLLELKMKKMALPSVKPVAEFGRASST